jgi:hypothetical protein
VTVETPGVTVSVVVPPFEVTTLETTVLDAKAETVEVPPLLVTTLTEDGPGMERLLAMLVLMEVGIGEELEMTTVGSVTVETTTDGWFGLVV